jgi:hypothetical protein
LRSHGGDDAPLQCRIRIELGPSPPSPGLSLRVADRSVWRTLVERACDLIRRFEMDIYDNSLVPVALAHRHASISLVPGGKVLDLLVRSGLGAGKKGS